MKNKKIILGLGTITALGAMSMAFVACGLKAGDIDEKIKNFKEKEMPNLIKAGIFEYIVDEYFAERGKGDTNDKTDPKNLEHISFDQNSTVEDLMAKIEEMPGFKRDFKLHVSEEEKSKKLKDVSSPYKIWVVKANENPLTTNLKKEIEFKFKVK
ncbi:MAG: hypothetical protein E7Y34_02285 [Mycoplasma sp.]|nr:hypothetical protein [Mycoplasma sp.]